MQDQLPPPDFDSQNYDRPNQPFLCGWAAMGRACARGPDGAGHCRATFECRPTLKKRSEDDAGEWLCTRARSQGGNCGDGPLPDGTCCRPVAPCQPVPSLRTRRGRICIMFSAVTFAALMLFFFLPDYGLYVSPGKLSSYHTGPTFVAFKKTGSGTDGCAACHTGADGGPRSWLAASVTANPRPWDIKGLFKPHHAHLTTIDQACVECHPKHGFHQPNVTRDHSCTLCHMEHQGSGRMPPPRPENCASCHDDVATMTASRLRADKIPSEAFDYWRVAGLKLFPTKRPTEGFTHVFTSFSKGHPEFQIHREQKADENSLRFNHSLHLGEVVRGDGLRLQCNDCHSLDASGAYYQRIDFESHCRDCHSLQFDAGQPALLLPHGNPEFVRSFLASLPVQYAELARAQGRTTTVAVEEFVQTQMRRMQREGMLGDALVQRIFKSADPSRQTASTTAALGGRGSYNGCAYCHEVEHVEGTAPKVTGVFLPDRWLARGKFNHSKHLNVRCLDCHDAQQSRETSDILLPTQASCTSCHSERGGVSESCSLCHSYHNVEKRY